MSERFLVATGEGTCLFVHWNNVPLRKHYNVCRHFFQRVAEIFEGYYHNGFHFARKYAHISVLGITSDACFGSQTWEDIQITSKTLKENTAFYDTMHYRVIFGSGENLPGARIVSSIVTWRHYIHLFGSFFFQLSLEALQPSKFESM